MKTKPHRAVPGRRPDAAKEKFWREVIHRWAASGQGVRAFCRGQDVSVPSFYAWRRTLARRQGLLSLQAPRVPTPAFLPVQVSVEDAAPVNIEIALSSGERIGLRPPVDRAALIDVLAALRLAAREA